MKGFDFVGFISYFGNGFLWRGALTTLWLTAIPIAAGLVLGTFVALMNMSKNRALQGFRAILHLDLSRNTAPDPAGHYLHRACRSSASVWVWSSRR